jgi:uncharacterized protein (TIGR00295 family)
MRKIPSPEKCIELLEKSGCSKAVINHSKAVRDIALKLCEKAHANSELIEVGALLHDIGRSKTHGIFHALEGAEIARKLGLPKSVIYIIERHIGAGISLETAIKLKLPPKDYIPLSLEEKIVCHADNLIDNCKKQNIEIEINKALKEGKKDYAKRLVDLHRELSDICNIDVNFI